KHTMQKVYAGCRSAGIGCLECKSWAADSIIAAVAPMQERRRKYEANPRAAWDIIEAGNAKARKEAEANMTEVREAMGLSHAYQLAVPGLHRAHKDARRGHGRGIHLHGFPAHSHQVEDAAAA